MRSSPLTATSSISLAIVIPVSSEAVDAGPDQEMSSNLLCCAEKLVDVTLAITNMDASSPMIQELRRLLEIFQPPDAFFFR
jgi:hypothetical protein